MKRSQILALLVLFFSLWGLVFNPAAVLAQGGVTVTDVQPNTVSNSTSTLISVTGSGFQDGAEVELEGSGALATTFISQTSLQVQVPAGIAPGTYAITVRNPDSSWYTVDNFLTVTAAVTGPPVTPEPTTPVDPNSTPFTRPLVVVESYRAGEESVSVGQVVNLVVRLRNNGGTEARNVVVTFAAGDFIPRETGGVAALRELDAGENRRIEQPLIATTDLYGKTVATIAMQVTYTDRAGVSYSETFTLSLPVKGASGPAVPTATPTAVEVFRPQLVISGYSTDVETLQPGTRFSLNLNVHNVGNDDARRVTMILGGGSSSSTDVNGTPVPGGVDGGSGDFGNFAPVDASNVQFLGDLAMDGSITARADLIVNASANPGAYPMKISFTYTSEDGLTYTDDQVITLLVFSLPQLEVNFYRDPGVLFSSQPNMIPLQVVNLGRKTAVLGNMRVTAENAEISNNTTLVGALDPGGYYTLDPMVVPFGAGPLDLTVTIDYTDDFNQPQSIVRTITVEVMESEPMPEGPDGGFPGEFPGEMPGEGGMVDPLPVEDSGPESFWDKVLRFIKGLLGLDSGRTSPDDMLPGGMPPGEEVFPEDAPLDVGPIG